MAHSDARERKWRGIWQIEWEASTLHTASEHGVYSISTADAHTSAASSRLKWRPRWFKWTRPFRRKTKSGFYTCAITFQMQSKNIFVPPFPSPRFLLTCVCILHQFSMTDQNLEYWNEEICGCWTTTISSLCACLMLPLKMRFLRNTLALPVPRDGHAATCHGHHTNLVLIVIVVFIQQYKLQSYALHSFL
jgi:hypothetical protein